MKIWLTIFMLLCLLGNFYVTSVNLNMNNSDRVKQSSLTKGKPMKSKNERYYAIIQNDGNLAIFSSKSINKKGFDNMIWNTKLGKVNDDTKLVMQADGNLVLMDSNNKSLWATNTGKKGKAPYSVIMQDDGNLVLYSSEGKKLWESGTAGKL